MTLLEQPQPPSEFTGRPAVEVGAAAETAALPVSLVTTPTAAGVAPAALPLDEALSKLRISAVRRAVNAQLGMCLAAAITAGFGGLMTVTGVVWLWFNNGYVPGIHLYSVAGLALLGYSGVVLFTNRVLFGYYCWLERRRLSRTPEVLLFTDDELHRSLQQWLPSQFWGAVSPKAQFTTFAQRLEHCAFHLDSLRCLARDPERKPPGLWLSERTYELARMYDNALIPIAGCLAVAVPFLGLLATLALPLQFLVAPRAIRAAAYLAAFIDNYQEKAQDVVDKFPPPAEPRGWLARTFAPWKRDGS